MKRLEALQQGIRKYPADAPCKKNHVPTWRYTKTGICVDCARDAQAQYQDKFTRGLINERYKLRALPRINMHVDVYDAALSYLRSLNAMMGVPLHLSEPPLRIAGRTDRPPGYVDPTEVERRKHAAAFLEQSVHGDREPVSKTHGESGNF